MSAAIHSFVEMLAEFHGPHFGYRLRMPPWPLWVETGRRA